jgi:hypothetical protein
VMTFRQFASRPESIPAATSWYLADLGEARGKQDLFTKQSPQKLKALRENAMIESAVSSNRIEGVTVDQARIKAVVFGKSLLRDRDEEEVRGYRDALNLIHEQGRRLSVTEETILNLHRLCRGNVWDAGRYKDKDGDIIERYPDGRERICGIAACLKNGFIHSSPWQLSTLTSSVFTHSGTAMAGCLDWFFSSSVTTLDTRLDVT